MDFFSDLDITLWGNTPEQKSWHVARPPVYFGIQYNHSGTLRLIKNGREYQVDGPHVFITHPFTDFEYGVVKNSHRHNCFICAAGERIQRYIKSGLLELDHNPPLIPVSNPEKFLQTMLTIQQMAAKNIVLPPRAVWLYEDLLLQIHEFCQTRKKLPLNHEPNLSDLIKRINHDPQLKWNFSAEARRNGVTLPHFRRLFKELTKLPPSQYVIQCRLARAANLLITTDHFLSEIAEECGFENQFYFSKLFKHHYFVSPREYRRQYSGRVVNNQQSGSV